MDAAQDGDDDEKKSNKNPHADLAKALHLKGLGDDDPKGSKKNKKDAGNFLETMSQIGPNDNKNAIKGKFVVFKKHLQTVETDLLDCQEFLPKGKVFNANKAMVNMVGKSLEQVNNMVKNATAKKEVQKTVLMEAYKVLHMAKSMKADNKKLAPKKEKKKADDEAEEEEADENEE